MALEIVLGVHLVVPGSYQEPVEPFVLLGWYSTQLFQWLGEKLGLFKGEWFSTKYL